MLGGVEHQLLIAAATPSELRPAAAPSLDEIDWRELLTLAEHHRMGGLVHRYLQSADAVVPRYVFDHLGAERKRIAARELGVRAELNEVVETLSGAGVRAVALKGAALIDCVYKQAGLRPMADLDLLVAPGEADLAMGALRDAGYRPARGTPQALIDYYGRSKHHHLVPLVHASRSFPVELHTRLVRGIEPRSTEEVIARAAEGSTPGPTDLLFHLAVHFAYHRLSSSARAVGQLADLAHAIEGNPTDWAALKLRSREFALTEAVFAALYAVDRLKLARIPGDTLDEMRPRSLTSRLGEQLLSERVLTVDDVGLEIELPPSVRSFFLPGRAYMRTRYELPDAGLPRLYLERARIALRMLRRDQTALNRWLRRATNTPLIRP